MDVTKRRQAEELFRLATEASPSGTLLVDEKGHILLVNAHIEELFGYRRDELIGQPVEMLVADRVWTAHPGLRDRFLGDPKARRCGRAGNIRAAEGRERIPGRSRSESLETPQGLRVLANVVDISARKAAEEEARHHREQIDRLSRASIARRNDGFARARAESATHRDHEQCERGPLVRRERPIGSRELREILVSVAAEAGAPTKSSRTCATR